MLVQFIDNHKYEPVGFIEDFKTNSIAVPILLAPFRGLHGLIIFILRIVLTIVFTTPHNVLLHYIEYHYMLVIRSFQQ